MGLFWLGIIVIAVLIDIFTSSFLFSGFSIGALLAMLIYFLEGNLYIQVIVFAIVGVLFILFISPKVKKSITKNFDKTINKIDGNLIGKIIISEKDIINEEIMILEGAYWTFKNEGEAIKKGDLIKITSIQGNKILVKK